MSDNVLGSLLPDLYGCAGEPSNWRRVLDQICRHFSARSAVIQMLRRADNVLYPEWDLRDSLSSQHADSHDRYVNNEHNPRLNLSIVRGFPGASAILRDEERFRPGCPHLARLRERLAMIGMGRSIAIALKVPVNRQLTLLLHRVHGDGREFGARDESFLCELAPHLIRSVDLFEKINTLRDDADLVKQFADRMKTGILVVDCRGTVRWQNRYAELIIKRSQHLGVVGGRLWCSNAESHRRISRFLRQVSSNRQRLLTTIGAPHCDPIQILGMPLHVSATPRDTPPPHGATIALLLSAPDGKVVLSPSDIRELFGLTPAEAALAAALAEGLTLQDYAERHGVSVGTLRVQLKSVFSKTGATRQPELVRLLCASIPARTLTEHP
jgi:DNA-binding CsgD family transcriptional regulator